MRLRKVSEGRDRLERALGLPEPVLAGELPDQEMRLAVTDVQRREERDRVDLVDDPIEAVGAPPQPAPGVEVHRPLTAATEDADPVDLVPRGRTRIRRREARHL